jgi:aryl-alcohol dehydrogenase-like predicted oxidoreductase
LEVNPLKYYKLLTRDYRMRMEFRYIGDVKVSEVGLGTWQFSDSWGVTSYDLAKSIIERALDVGVNFFDTAAVYGMGMSERFLGQALKELGERENVFIATKIPGEFLSKHDVFKATKRSMERLGSYIDLMQVHWPPCWG